VDNALLIHRYGLTTNTTLKDEPHVSIPPRPRPGRHVFLTFNLLNRRSELLVRHIDLLRETVRVTRSRHPFHIDTWVVLPDHMHRVWTLPDGDADFALRWNSFTIFRFFTMPRHRRNRWRQWHSAGYRYFYAHLNWNLLCLRLHSPSDPRNLNS